MKKILTVFLKNFRNEAHYEFMSFVRDLITNFAVVQFIIGEWLDTFRGKVKTEEQLLDAVRKSILTPQIVIADKRVDNSVIGFKAAVTSYLYGLDPNKKQAAQIIMNRIKTVGKITAKSYEDEAGGLRKLILDFEGEYAGQIATLGLTEWVVELKAAEADFRQLMLLRNAERSNKLPDNLKEVRRELDIIYHKIIDIVNSAATISGAGEYEEFAKQLNVQIKYFNEHAAHKKTKKDIADTVAETVPPQKFTGKAIIVIPNLTGEDGNQLVFSVDFSVRYKNNTAIGNAKIIVTGKGNYKGTKEIGFDIIN
jgi:hypothetical protein